MRIRAHYLNTAFSRATIRSKLYGLLPGTLHGHALVSLFYLQTIEENIRVLFSDEVSSGSRGQEAMVEEPYYVSLSAS